MTDLRDAWLNQFSENTAGNYRRDIAQFASWLNLTAGKAEVLDAERTDVQDWIKHLRTRRHLAAPTVRRKTSAVSSFFEYAAQEGHIAYNPARHTKRPKGETAIKLGLEQDQARKLVAAAKAHSRDAYALTLLMITSGLRISEAVGIDIEHITETAGYPVVEVTRKGGTRAYVRIAHPVRDAVLAAADNRDEGPVFLGPRQHRLARRQAGTLIKELGTTAGVGHVTPHLLRHTAATNAIRAGATEGEVQELLGHRSGDTTRRYIRALQTADRSPVDKLTDFYGIN